MQTCGFYQKIAAKFGEKSTNYRCFPATAKWFSSSHRHIPMKLMMILSSLNKRPSFCNSLHLLVSKGLHTFFTWMKTLEDFHRMGRFNIRKVFGKTACLPSLPVYGQPKYFLLRHVMLHTFRVSSSTQVPCCFKLLTFRTPVRWWPPSMNQMHQ